MDDDNVDLMVQFVIGDGEDSDSSDSISVNSRESGQDSPASTSERPHPDITEYFDSSLPSQHLYLGTDLTEVSGRTILDDGSYQTLSLLPLPGVQLVPGQTIPLQLYNQTLINRMMNIIEGDHLFGLVNSRFSGRTFRNILDSIGTVAEIRSFGADEAYPSPLKLKAEGRERFEILNTERTADGLLVGKIRILPDFCVPSSEKEARLPSLNKFRTPTKLCSPIEESSSSSQCNLLLHRPSHKNRFDFANYTPFPQFVYKMFDPHILMERILQFLHGWNKSLLGDFKPCDPKEFSYWIAANLPLDDNQRRELLSINEVVHRLQRELKIIQECSVLACRDCQMVLSRREEIFSLSREGPLGTYVNANGYVHETVTVHKASGLRYIGLPSEEQSWFPGYAWTIVECRNCQTHVGWKFTAVDKKLKPEKFWALTRSSIINRLSS